MTTAFMLGHFRPQSRTNAVIMVIDRLGYFLKGCARGRATA